MNTILAAIGGAMIGSFLWMTAIGMLLAVVLLLARHAAPEKRHAVITVALAAVPAAFVLALDVSGSAERVVAVPLAVLQALPEGAGFAAGFEETDWARPAAIAWLCGVVLLSLRTFGGWLYLRHLIRRAKPMEWESMSTLAVRFGLATPELRTSSRVDSPFTAGWRHPVVVVPLAMVTGLPAEQFEAIVLHELAHIRRGDYLAEWMLRTLETLFFYHPAVWWMTAMLRRERERSCDDMAIAAGADRGCYAKALLGMEELRVPAMAAGVTGSDLRGRVTRILGHSQTASPWPVVLGVVVLGMAGFAQQQPMTPYDRWVAEDVVYIISVEERQAFAGLRDDAEKTKFIEQFWERRKALKEEHYRRIAYANERFREPAKGLAGWKTERGRTYIMYGPPDEIESHPTENNEQWFYKEIPGVGKQIIFTFGDRRRPRR
ncbi:MAG: GWxTD domain-containing protein [Acidobacteria bacterium]|nr:GWxTD domain-containing protein [Acidobacteriota bacterium]